MWKTYAVIMNPWLFRTSSAFLDMLRIFFLTFSDIFVNAMLIVVPSFTRLLGYENIKLRDIFKLQKIKN